MAQAQEDGGDVMMGETGEDKQGPDYLSNAQNTKSAELTSGHNQPIHHPSTSTPASHSSSLISPSIDLPQALEIAGKANSNNDNDQFPNKSTSTSYDNFNQPPSASAPKGFHFFNRPPPELRLKIWRRAFPQNRAVDILNLRVYTTDMVDNLEIGEWDIRYVIPAILWVNHESRVESQKRYIALTAEIERLDYSNGNEDIKIVKWMIYRNPRLDTAILNFRDVSRDGTFWNWHQDNVKFHNEDFLSRIQDLEIEEVCFNQSSASLLQSPDGEDLPNDLVRLLWECKVLRLLTLTETSNPETVYARKSPHKTRDWWEKRIRECVAEGNEARPDVALRRLGEGPEWTLVDGKSTSHFGGSARNRRNYRKWCAFWQREKPRHGSKKGRFGYRLSEGDSGKEPDQATSSGS